MTYNHECIHCRCIQPLWLQMKVSSANIKHPCKASTSQSMSPTPWLIWQSENQGADPPPSPPGCYASAAAPFVIHQLELHRAHTQCMLASDASVHYKVLHNVMSIY